ncbi:MAG: hypothetical protein Q4E57_05890 [Eubacteriales bacterium]|nr:hypothetical protein [Eubacteriales bacterium]
MYMAVYAKDRPKDCSYCYYGNRKGRCRLGKDNCYYIIKVTGKTKDPCDGCPYSRGGPCIGWCTRKILEGPEAIEETEALEATDENKETEKVADDGSKDN